MENNPSSDDRSTEPSPLMPEADLPRPPIWEQASAAPGVPPRPPVPPVAPSLTTPPPRATPIPGARPATPIVPDISSGAASTSGPAAGAAQPGPTFAQRQIIDRQGTPAGQPAGPAAPSNAPRFSPPATTPQWPTQPPLVGQTPSPAQASAPERPRARTGLVLVSLLAIAALAAGAFFFGRSLSNDELATVPIADTREPTVAPQPTDPPATSEPAPTQQPAPETAAPAPAQSPPVSEDAAEPVAAAAAAVAPAVVLIQNDIGQGSGIIYDESGLILTNAHVVGSFTAVSVRLASGVIVPGEVLGADPQTDVAVVSINTDELFGVATLAPDSSVEVGQLAVAIGSPFGLEQTVTSGVVSAVGRVLTNPTDDGRGSIVAMIQTDAPINPGNSGGALADRQGRVIGMNTSIRTDGAGGNIGVGFAIPSDTALLIANRIVAGEPLEQGLLGVSGETPQLGAPGVVIIEVVPGSGADVAGLEVGDLITSFNGEKMSDINDLVAAVRLQRPEDVVMVEFQRNGELLSVSVNLGASTEQ